MEPRGPSQAPRPALPEGALGEPAPGGEPETEPWGLLARVLGRCVEPDAGETPDPGGAQELAAAADALLARVGRAAHARRVLVLRRGERGWEGRSWAPDRAPRELAEGERAELDWALLDLDGALLDGVLVEAPPRDGAGARPAAGATELELDAAALATRGRLAGRGLARVHVVSVRGADGERSALWVEVADARAPRVGRLAGDLARALHELFRLRAAAGERARRAELVELGETARAWAHDLRNELAVARLRVERLAGEGGGERAGVAAELARDLDRGGALCRRLLAGRPARRERIALRELLAEEARRAAAHVRRDAGGGRGAGASQAGAPGVRARVACPRDLAVRADRTALARLVANLLSNALQASPEGGTVEVVAARVAEPGGPAVRITVADEGPGLDERRRRRLFAPGRSGRAGGTGYGTASALRCADELGARLAVESAPRRGTRVHVTLAAPAPGGGADGPRPWIVADPVAARRRIRAERLRRAGQACVEAAEPERLDELLDEHPGARIAAPAAVPAGAWADALERARRGGAPVRASGCGAAGGR